MHRRLDVALILVWFLQCSVKHNLYKRAEGCIFMYIYLLVNHYENKLNLIFYQSDTFLENEENAYETLPRVKITENVAKKICIFVSVVYSNVLKTYQLRLLISSSLYGHDLFFIIFFFAIFHFFSLKIYQGAMKVFTFRNVYWRFLKTKAITFHNAI